MTLASATEKPPPLQLPPLTRNDYRRSAEVEDQIRTALTLSRPLLRQRVAIRDYDASDFLQEEALAFLIRHYHAAGKIILVNDVSVALVERITGRIKRWLRSVGLDEGTTTFDDAFRDVIAAVFAGVRPEGRGEPSGGLLDHESDKADYAQDRFWPFLDGRIRDVLRRAGVTRGRNVRHVDIDDLAGHGRGAEEEGAHNPISDWDEFVPELSPDKHTSRFVDGSAVVAAIKHLPNDPRPLQEVLCLWYFGGWQVESKDPNQDTLSSRYGKTPRAIRNWLREAEGLLATLMRTK